MTQQQQQQPQPQFLPLEVLENSAKVFATAAGTFYRSLRDEHELPLCVCLALTQQFLAGLTARSGGDDSHDCPCKG